MIRKSRVGIVVFALAFAGTVAQAQATPQGQLWYIHQEMAKPSMLAEWNSTTLEVMQLAAKVKAPTLMKGVVLEGDDLTFTFAAPIQGFAGIGALSADFELMAKSDPKAFGDLMKRGYAPVDSVREFILEEHAELSYKPEKPSLKPEDARFYHYDIYYIVPGHEEEAAAVAKDFLALFKVKGVSQGYRIFTVVSGPDMPALIVEVPAKSGADYYTTDEAARMALGDAGKALFQRAFAITRRLEHRNAVMRADLSPALWPAK